MPEDFFLQPFVVGYIGLTGACTLFGASYLIRNLIGFVYTSQKRPDLAKIAYMDFWGRRIDFVTPIDNIEPFSEQKAHVLDKLVSFIKLYDENKTLKLSYKIGGVLDVDEMTRVFGSG
jgi:hypothetical protein